MSSDVWRVTVSPRAINTPLVCLHTWGGKPVVGRQRITTGLLMTEKQIRAISEQPGGTTNPHKVCQRSCHFDGSLGEFLEWFSLSDHAFIQAVI